MKKMMQVIFFEGFLCLLSLCDYQTKSIIFEAGVKI